LATIVDGYTRISGDKQEEGTSLAEQERAIREYCAAHKLTIGMIHREVHTGSVYRERKKLTLMRERYLEGKIQGVVFRNYDRLARSSVHQAFLLEEMEHAHTEVHCTHEQLDDTFEGKMTRMLLGLLAEYEWEKIRERTSTGRINRIKNGQHREGPKILYGYQWHDEQAKDYRVINEAEASICLWLHEEFAHGVGPRALLRAVVERAPERKWTRGAIHQILSDPRRTGTNAQAFTRHKNSARKPFEAIDLPDGTYPQIIPPELFAKNQERLRFNKAEATRQCKEPERFLLRAGFIKCDICKRNMLVNASRSRSAPIYFCSDGGHSNTVNADTIGRLVWDYMVRLADEIELIERAIQLATNNAASLREIAAITRSIANSEVLIAQYTEDLTNPALKGTGRDVILGLLSNETAKLATKQEEQSLVEAGIVDLDRLAHEADKILAWCKTVKEAREELTYQEKRDFLRILGIRVFIDKSDKRREDLLWRIEASLPEVQELIMSNTYKRASTDSVTHISTCYP